MLARGRGLEQTPGLHRILDVSLPLSHVAPGGAAFLSAFYSLTALKFPFFFFFAIFDYEFFPYPVAFLLFVFFLPPRPPPLSLSLSLLFMESWLFLSFFLILVKINPQIPRDKFI